MMKLVERSVERSGGPKVFNLFFILVMLNLADAMLTTHLVNQFDFGIEQNPLLHLLMTKTGTVLALWIWKALALWFLADIIKKTADKTEFWTLALTLTDVALALVVLWDGFVMVRLA